MSNQPTSLQVVFLIDITGSMSNQIEGVKQMIAKFCEVDRPQIDVHIWTFTENPGCHVSKSPVGLKSSDLVKYTLNIKLSTPPDNPTISAGGGDGPENVTAGVAALLDSFTIDQNLLCFLITDAPPHHKVFGNGIEAQDEIKWLQNAGFEETDIFIILCQIIDSLNITFVPVLYGEAQTVAWYHQAATMTEGIVLCPKQASSEVLAKGLSALLDTFQKLSVSRDINLLKSLNIEDLAGFAILDINPEEFKMIEEDPENQKNREKLYKTYKGIGGEVLAEKIAAPFTTALERFDGKKEVPKFRKMSMSCDEDDDEDFEEESKERKEDSPKGKEGRRKIEYSDCSEGSDSLDDFEDRRKVDLPTSILAKERKRSMDYSDEGESITSEKKEACEDTEDIKDSAKKEAL